MAAERESSFAVFASPLAVAGSVGLWFNAEAGTEVRDRRGEVDPAASRRVLMPLHLARRKALD